LERLVELGRPGIHLGHLEAGREERSSDLHHVRRQFRREHDLGHAGLLLVVDYTSFTCLSGRLRTGLPVAAKMALSTAGVTTEIVGSPTPPQKASDGPITASTFGLSARREDRKR